MSREKTAQKKKLLRQRIGNGCCLIGLSIMTLFFWVNMVCSAVVWVQIRTDALHTYSGGFELKQREIHRNTLYYMVLENGDVLYTNTDEPETARALQEKDRLQFSYAMRGCGYRYSFPEEDIFSAYTCVEIAGVDGNDTYLMLQTSEKEAALRAVLGAFFGTLCLGLAVIFVSPGFVTGRKRKKK